MSRVHCQVHVDGGKTLLVDNGSAAGTWVRGAKIDEYALQPGDIFQLGDTQIRYQLDAVHDHSTMAGPLPAAKPRATSAASSPLKDLVGQTLHVYRLDKIITMGNTGMMFRAHDTQKDRACAVKVLSPEYTENEEQKERFIRAMKTMLPIKHENLVELYGAGKQGPYCWAAMEFVDGESLTQVIDRIGAAGMLDWRETWRVGVHIGRALHEAYEQKIIHRNVTPPNILRRSSDKVCKLGDLMLAKALEGAQAKQVTQPGQLIGDVPYMSPERTRGQDKVDCRSDIYGLGATLYALLTGRPPFESSSLPELIRMVREAAPVKPREHQLAIPELFQDAVLKMIAKKPEDRFQKPIDLVRDLERIGKYQGLTA
jgi:serine/threonine protein kinase